MSNDAASRAKMHALVEDYELVATLGFKRTVDLDAAGVGARAALDRLVEAGLALEILGSIVLMRPNDWSIRLAGVDADASVDTDLSTDADADIDLSTDRLHNTYLNWLRAGASHAQDELLFGEPGFWQHFWNRISERDYAKAGPLLVDIVVPDDGTFSARAWLAEFDPQIRSHVLDDGLIRGRVILPPDSVKSVVEPMLDLVAESGLQVRVLSTDARFVLYDGATAILNEPQAGYESQADQADGEAQLPEAYWAVRRDEIAMPLRQFFDLLWQAATPFRAHRGEYDEVLELLGRGLTDSQIAKTLNVSPRTVSRRVSELMNDFGASSRFELGMCFERASAIRDGGVRRHDAVSNAMMAQLRQH